MRKSTARKPCAVVVSVETHFRFACYRNPFTEEAITAWKAELRTTRGGQRWYSPLAILT